MSRFLPKTSLTLSLLLAGAAFAGAAEPVDSLALPTGKTDWVDPVKAVAPGCEYVVYPTPSRGADTQASCMVYTPAGYDAASGRRYPVVYYLHGGTGNQREARWMIAEVDKAIREGRMEPIIVVSPQALPIGWYINANTSDPKVTSGPIRDVIIEDLIPYIDANYSTIASPSGRGIEGFSMGGRGALALAFGNPDLFGAVSSVAGAVVNWEEEPLQRALECTFGDVDDPFSKLYFDSWHPAGFACRNADQIRERDMKVRLFVGDRDRLYNENGNAITERFHNVLERLGINHSYTIVPGADHNPTEIFDPAVNTYDIAFWDTAFANAALPEGILSFLATNFPGASILSAKTVEEANGPHYLLDLSDGTHLKFNEHSNWIRVTSDRGPVAAGLVHQGIRDYLESIPEGSVSKIRSIEKVPRVGYDVTFDDGAHLTFDTTGRLLK